MSILFSAAACRSTDGQRGTNLNSTQAPLQPRITVVGPTQAIRVTYPGASGGLITSFFEKRASANPGDSVNAAAKAIAEGAHAYGALSGGEFEEPAFFDAGQAVFNERGVGLVIGNRDYDVNKKMGATANDNRVVDTAVSDANKVTALLKARGMSVTEKHNLTAAQIKAELQSAVATVPAEGCFVLYFCGHGTFDGLIGVDGPGVSAADVEPLFQACLTAKSDLVVLADACHQGLLADFFRLKCLEHAKTQAGPAKSQNDLTLLDAAIALQQQKDAFNAESWNILLRQFEIEEQNPGGGEDWEQHYRTRIDAWSVFVDAAQAKVDAAIAAANQAGVSFAPLTLQKYTGAREEFDQNDETEIWRQLDSVDMLLNAAVEKGWA
jgi:hypothetical protein